MPTLNWLTREQDINEARKAPYRLLNHVETFGESDTKNMLIQGDNLDALKALLPYYAGTIKCIYIDPPYNTKSAFEHYDDNLEHTKWLSLMYPRLELLHNLLATNGSIWISVDDNESHYLKIILDEIFGRNNFISNVIWQKKYAPANDAKWLSGSHDHILVYAKNKESWYPNKIKRDPSTNKSYKNPDSDPRGLWRADNYTCAKSAKERPNLYYPIINPKTKEEVWPSQSRVWAYNPETHQRHIESNLIWWGKNGTNKVPAYKRFLKDLDLGVTPQTIWTWNEVGHTQDGRKEQKTLIPTTPFQTAKPEKLIHHLLSIATKPEDIVLDSFLGSGTTAAVAHKMGRKYIGIEIGEHAQTHCIPRLKKVVEGEQGGISKSVEWQGGGGFRFLQLEDAVFDHDGKVASNIKFEHLAAHIWFTETQAPLLSAPETPLLGVYNGIAYYLLYNGILKDKRPSSANVLNSRILQELPEHNGPKVIYGERTLFGPARLEQEQISFKLTPYDINGR